MAMYMDHLKPDLPELINLLKLIYPVGDVLINNINKIDIAGGVIAVIKNADN
ncbi:hypothetical protein JMUB7504_27570 [Staphylococcus aureus]